MAILERNDAGGIAHLHMNAPDRLNALSDEMIATLHSTLDTIAADTSTRAVILSGAGKAFCAGHDLREMTAARQAEDGGAAALKNLFDRCAALMARIQSLPQPVIAQVHGIATAAGCQLVATCDMAVAAHGTRFGVNGVNIGLFCSTPMVALSRAIPRKQAFEMLTTGSFIDAQRAETLGLINRVAPPEALPQETRRLAEAVAEKLAVAVRFGKPAFYAQAHLPTAEAYAFTGDVMVANMLDQDTEEGIAAFLEKRDPTWTQ
ncbi:MAG: enoyl-CoA hydratase [Pseudomonadota bacterium]